ncbi:phospholipid methyltransferase-domain-containing protein [Chytriomyces sp. MP71]|nr:phospholipid methyltransferase-domain-containing protein [Chytriomyces sp. MP71]
MSSQASASTQSVASALRRVREHRNGLQEPIHSSDLSFVTVGRTRKGEVFHIPSSPTLFHSLLFPSCVFDWITLFLVGATLAAFVALGSRRSLFLTLFVFWRVLYNLAIGLLLRVQSDYNLLVRYAKRLGFGQNAGKRRGPWQAFFISELIKKLELDDKEFNNLPVEFTTWILFRALVDTVLVNDFLSHTLFAIAYFKNPVYDNLGPELFGIGWRDWLRYTAGCVLLLVNYGIKIEGNRAVSDYAWYWGDFFFFQTSESVPQSPTSPTDSAQEPYAPIPPPHTFELAPHPMYSVGYIGFYAAALIAKSYTVFFVSLVAHLAQIGFFFFVESYHFERTYGPPAGDGNMTEGLQSLFRRDLLVFKNFDPFRSTDVLTVLVWVLTFVNALVVGRVGENHEGNWRVWYFVGQALIWRFMYSGVLGYVLHLQSKCTFWSRHFIKFGETSFDAFRHWKIIYNLCQSMTYISFFLCAFMLYKPPEIWLVGSVMLKHTVALILILLHIWTTFSIHKTLGEYGWFFGDFFIDSLVSSKSPTSTSFTGATSAAASRGPTYTGLYRFLNHPNAWAAAASAWGVTVATGSPHVLFVTLLSQFCGWCFVFLVEAPHMRRRYGDLVRTQDLVDELLVHDAGGSVQGQQEFLYVRNVRGSLTSMRGLRRRIGGGSGALGSRRTASDGGMHAPLRSSSGSSAFSRVTEWRNEQIRHHSMSSEDGSVGDPEDDGLIMRAGTTSAIPMEGEDDDTAAQSRGSDGDDEDDPGAVSSSEFVEKVGIHGNARNPISRNGVGLSRSFSNPGRVQGPASFDRMSSSFDSSGFAQMNQQYGVAYLAKTASSGSLKRASTFTAAVVKGAVSHAKPRVDKIVNEARNIVKNNVEKLAGSHWAQTQQLPRHLYSVTFAPTNIYSAISNSSTPRFQLGMPITIQFTCVRETLKRRDWIGIYPVGDNLSTEVTTSKSFSRWMFLTATPKNTDDDNMTPLMTKVPAGYESSLRNVNAIPHPIVEEPEATRTTRSTTRKLQGVMAALPLEQELLFGNTIVHVRPSDEDQGLRIVTGSLLFRRSKVPWQCGTYEARYHYDGGYSVVTFSRPFEIVAECFQWNDLPLNQSLRNQALSAASFDIEVQRIEAFLRGPVELCVDIDVSKGESPLDVNEDILGRVVMDEWIEDLSESLILAAWNVLSPF